MAQDSYVLGIAGGGSTGLNQAYDAVEQYQLGKAAGKRLPPLHIIIFDPGPSDQLGKGFAHGVAAAGPFALTEPPHKGHQDYRKHGRPKNAQTFSTFLQKLRATTQDVTAALRSEYGLLQQSRWQELQSLRPGGGVTVEHRREAVSDIVESGHGLRVVTARAESAQCDQVVVAVGDIGSNKFLPVAEAFPGQAFDKPYTDAIVPKVLAAQAGNPAPELLNVVLQGSRSSALDAALRLREAGYKGQITAVSPSGAIPYLARPERGHTPVHLTPEKLAEAKGSKLPVLFRLLAQELTQPGIYAPQPLLQTLDQTIDALEHGEKPGKLAWRSDAREDIKHARDNNYHEVIGYTPWAPLYQQLTRAEQQTFQRVMNDTIVHECTNCVVPESYAKLSSMIESGDLQILHGRIKPDGISKAPQDRLHIDIGAAQPVVADFIVNCSGGAAPVKEQAEIHPLLINLAAKQWIKPNEHGGGFAVRPDLAERLSFGGWQGRKYGFSSLGLESYGSIIVETTAKLMQNLAARTVKPVRQLGQYRRRESLASLHT